MSEVLGVTGFFSGSGAGCATFGGGSAGSAVRSVPSRSSVDEDVVELSGKATAPLAEPRVREALVDDVRRRIAEGSYLTADKLTVAAERLLKELHE